MFVGADTPVCPYKQNIIALSFRPYLGVNN